MKKNLVTKIALITAIVALLFSIVTMVRAIIIKTGIVLAVIEVIGTAVIVAICSIMLYVLSTTEDDDDDGDEDEDEDDVTDQKRRSAKKEIDKKQSDEEIDVDLNDIDDVGKYDLSDFE